jgi:hypothetical protein
MTLADYSMTAFALLNGGRAVAYFPQMMRVYRDPHDAAAVSVLTWVSFAAANAATVCYALTVSDDRVMAVMFTLNAIGCLAIVGLTAFKRMRFVLPRATLSNRIESLRHSQGLVATALSAAVEPPWRDRNYSPSTHYRDHIIGQGSMS